MKAAGELSYADGVKKERELFRKLMAGTQAAAMQHYFFAERAANKIDGIDPKIDLIPIKTVEFWVLAPWRRHRHELSVRWHPRDHRRAEKGSA